jgi:hypothetical protein
MEYVILALLSVSVEALQLRSTSLLLAPVAVTLEGVVGLAPAAADAAGATRGAAEGTLFVCAWPQPAAIKNRIQLLPIRKVVDI